ncbi:SCO1664 family protein [Actinacidiphila sp. ITFR-21]|uniref:SCO1664 family protein n=1 Tax=Actinacidiphila sp. ITFR-21 TaxID=3075199 RepID=UPI00288C4EAC|nr:SCO1664 family protein [Streptomyces sp. ITFR-21]WNI14813.1 SCO1664 family protein [Streptomyces sp. ITFR-21]
MPASERVPEVGLNAFGGASGAPGGPAAPRGPGAPGDTDALTHGELTVKGRVRGASNTVLYCESAHRGRTVACVYKPVSGERPLWDFPDGTLAQREVAAYLVSEATGWGLVPPTVLREGPYGQGMVQRWIEPPGDGGEDGGDGPPQLLALTEDAEPGPGWKAVVEAELEQGGTALLVHADDIRLRRIAVLDAVINNADRKGGHLLPAADGRIYGIDHGVTFHTDDKLRTLLWGWAGEPFPAEAVAVLDRLTAELDGTLGERLATLLTTAETAALRARVHRLRETGTHPRPGGEWPSIPWPPV